MRKRRIPLEAETRKVFPVVELPNFPAEVIFGHHPKALLWATRWRSSWISSLFRCHIQLQWTRCRKRRTSLKWEICISDIIVLDYPNFMYQFHFNGTLHLQNYLQKVGSTHALIVLSVQILQSTGIGGNQTIWSDLTSDDAHSPSMSCASTWPISFKLRL